MPRVERLAQLQSLSPALFEVSQDDISVAAARAAAGIHVPATDDNRQPERTRTESINIYASPTDDNGLPISAAESLKRRLNQAHTSAAAGAALARAEIEAHSLRRQPFHLAALQAGAAQPPVDRAQIEELAAEDIHSRIHRLRAAHRC